jgi:DNA polymerase-3 subunit gamma/tau
MSYIGLARKFRPKNFDEIVEQDHVTKIIKNAIIENRVVHSYLFSGPRGCGKTSMARIFAKALNCENGPTVNPCDICKNCIDISKNTSIDVFEIDGASNNGIDEIRSLIENVKFSSINSRYKIYIIDEIQQITIQAFNALLKTLEEPPSHVIFIMATTEINKIPITILSRCQKYKFKLISTQKMRIAIKKIINIESFDVDDDAIDIIIRHSDGSMRDALTILDQSVFLKDKKITGDDLRKLLGSVPIDIISSITYDIANGNKKSILITIKKIVDDGYSVIQFIKDLKLHFRQIMICSINDEIIDVSNEYRDILNNQKEKFTIGNYLRISNLLSKAIEEMRWNDQQILVAEIYLLKISEPYYDIENLVNKIDFILKDMNSLKFDRTLINNNFKSIEIIWTEILDKILIEHQLSAQPLKRVLIDFVSEFEIKFIATNVSDYECFLKFYEKILELFRKKININFKVYISISNIKKDATNNISNIKDNLYKDENESTPEYIQKIAKDFESIAKKIKI